MTNKRFNIIAQLLLIAILAAQFSCAALQKNELDRNRKLWSDSNIKNYKMTIKIQKTGHATPNGKFIITVRNGVAESVTPFDKPEMDMLKDSVIQFGRYDTIEGIFSFIESAEKDKEKITGFGLGEQSNTMRNLVIRKKWIWISPACLMMNLVSRFWSLKLRNHPAANRRKNLCHRKSIPFRLRKLQWSLFP